MQIANALAIMEAQGYRFTAQGDTVHVYPPVGEQPPEADKLLSILRENKPAVLEAVKGRFCQVQIKDGDRHEIVIHNERDARQWEHALEVGLIALDGPVRFSQRQNIAYLTYRCALPEEWLRDALGASSKRKYNAILDRIHMGEAWLRANAHHPAYEAQYAHFLALFDDLKELFYTIANKPLDEPYKGYQEAMQ